METSKIIFAIYLFFAVYCAGSMTVLQLQHFSLYRKIDKDNFINYIKANNRAAVIPSILPAFIVLISTVILLFVRPAFVSYNLVVASLVLNIINFISSVALQARIHGRLEQIGYDQKLIETLVNTNWIRTVALFIQGILAVYCVMTALP